MSWLLRAIPIVAGVLLPLLGSADDPTAGGSGEAVQVASDEAVDVAPEELPPLSPLHPGPAEGFIAPSFGGPWRGRIALNVPLFNEIDIELDSGTVSDDLNLGLGWLLTNLKYIFPVDFEVRKGSFGAFVHTLFVHLDGATEITGRREHQLEWSDPLFTIDAGLSYELARWNLTENPRGPTLTLEPFAAARIISQPVEVTLDLKLGSPSTVTDFSSTSPIIGLRTFVDLDEHWNIRVEGDYGGFGVNDNHQTWQAVGLIGYRLPLWGAHWNLQLGYTARQWFDLRKKADVTMTLRGANIQFAVEF
jgi:hypothetical protein